MSPKLKTVKNLKRPITEKHYKEEDADSEVKLIQYLLLRMVLIIYFIFQDDFLNIVNGDGDSSDSDRDIHSDNEIDEVSDDNETTEDETEVSDTDQNLSSNVDSSGEDTDENSEDIEVENKEDDENNGESDNIDKESRNISNFEDTYVGKHKGKVKEGESVICETRNIDDKNLLLIKLRLFFIQVKKVKFFIVDNVKKIGVDEYADYDTSDEEDIRNTVGNIPMNWYNEYKHLGKAHDYALISSYCTILDSSILYSLLNCELHFSTNFCNDFVNELQIDNVFG